MYPNSNIWHAFWTKHVQMGQDVVEMWQVGGACQVPLGTSVMLGISRLSVLESSMKHCLYLFLCMAVRRCYGGRERERSRIGDAQVGNLRDFLGIRKMDRVTNAWMGKLCRVTKGIDERID